jgi:hypothetical protein
MTKNLLSFHSLYLFMKWTFIILTAVITSMLSAKAENGWAQSLDTRINIQFKDIPLKDALKQISKEVNIDFAYNTRIIPVDKGVSLSSKGEKLGVRPVTLLVKLTLPVSGFIGLVPVLKVAVDAPDRLDEVPYCIVTVAEAPLSLAVPCKVAPVEVIAVAAVVTEEGAAAVMIIVPGT